MAKEELGQGFLEKVQQSARAYAVEITSVVQDSWETETEPARLRPLFHVHFLTASGPCELHFDRDGGEIIWGEKVARFEKDDYPHGGIEQAVIDCLAFIFSGEAQRDPDSFPTATGCMLVPTFPFIWPLGKLYHGFEKRKKKKGSSE